MAFLSPNKNDDEIPEFSTEIRDASPSHLLLKIESFSLLWEHEIENYESRVFAAGEYSWKLVMYPNKDSISVELVVVGTSSLPKNWEFNAFFTLFLSNQISDNYLCFRGEVRRFNAIKTKWGFSKFISKESLSDPCNGFLVDDVCVFGAEVFVIKSERVNECISLMKFKSPYKRNWKFRDISEVGEIWRSEEFTTPECDHKWSVHLYPNGYGNGKDRSVSIFLNSVNSDEKVNAEFSMIIKNQLNGDNDKCRMSSTWFTSTVPSLGWIPFIPIEDFSCPFFLEVGISIQVVVKDVF